MNLRSPLIQQVSLDHWYRIEVFLVNEIGLFKRADIEPNGRVYLGCDLLIPSSTATSLTPFQRDESYQIYVRPCTLASSTLPITDIAGFLGNGKGSFEYKITINKEKHQNQPPQLGPRYLRIYCRQCDQFPKQLKTPPPENLDDLILPLVVGPIELTDIDPDLVLPTNTPIENLPSSIPTVHDTYRLFSFQSSSNNEVGGKDNINIAIHESWESGIPGKIWDSALVMYKMLKLMVQKNKTILDGKHIMDLSAGTGLIGLSVVEDANPSKVTITELDEALNLINDNVNLNKYLTTKCSLNVKALLWGDKQQAQGCGKADIILASDVLYESEFFEDLVKTFVDVCNTNGRIYIGYKRRGLDHNEEERFWKLCEQHFNITLLNDPSINDSDKDVVPPLAFESGVQIYKLIFK
ncbi:putative methyltransferase-domain-containing protein [Cunninghamella echinulata]|nr:putative methyltransferase-domain-containing protein [Cunninghamella echinulata]